MFQQNGWRTRGSASVTRRVVYLKHRILPSRSLSFSLARARFTPSPPTQQRRGGGDDDEGDESEGEREKATATGRREERIEKSRGKGGEKVDDDPRQPALPPSATPFSFSFRVVYRGMEDGKPATVRELTTFFRFSREEG